ncbi:MAG: serine O-acetyltransferase [Oscillospiraceae bacterium]
MHLLEDIRAYKKNDPAARSAIEVMLLYNGLHATIDYRIAHWFYLRRCFFIARAISQWSKMWTGIEIHPGATIGRRLVIDHGTGIVIGETAEIGDDCLLYQGVTLGGTGRISASAIRRSVTTSWSAPAQRCLARSALATTPALRQTL